MRPAREDEAAALAELALRAKSHWGYDQAFLEAARADLTIDAQTIRWARIYVIEHAGFPIGFMVCLGSPPRGASNGCL